jgi:AraC-like DNA-binding protein
MIAPMGLEAAPSFRAIVSQPLGRFAVEGTTLYWCVDRHLTGLALWGRPARADIERVLWLFDHGEDGILDPACDFILDLRAVESTDFQEFAGFERGVLARMEEIPKKTRRLACIRPTSGLIGALVEGFFNMIGSTTLTWSSFTALPPALEWCERENAVELATMLEEMVEGAIHGGPLAAKLRAWLSANGFRARVSDAADALDVSSRTLQRSLQLAGSSFRGELDRARLDTAESLLRETTIPLGEIAERLGFRSLAHFSNWFKKQRDIAPSTYREPAK